MKRVIIESPYKANNRYTVEDHVSYLNSILRAVAMSCVSPYASHRILTEALDDSDEFERARGIMCGLAWHSVADEMWVFVDMGISEGMKKAIDHAHSVGLPVYQKTLEEFDEDL